MIDEAGEIKCGKTAQFEADVKQTKISKRPVTWQKNNTGARNRTDVRGRKYSGSHNRQLLVNSVCKKDEGKYKAINTLTNCNNRLPTRKELPFIDVSKVTTERKGITVYYRILECSPKVYKIEWTKNGETLVFNNKKYAGGGLSDGFIIITSPTKADRGTYRCTVTNAVGSATKNVTLEPPTVSTFHKNYNETHSVTLIGDVSVINRYPKVHTVYWTKNGEKLNTQSLRGKYSKVNVKNPSLTIYNVNHQDAGSYQLIATNAVGSDKSDIVLDVPVIRIKRRENPDGSQCFTAKIKSTPAAYRAQWKVKKIDEDAFSLIDVNVAEYNGTSNSLPCPVLVVTKKELLENQCFHIKVDNFIGSTIKDIFDIPIRHFYYKPTDSFQHFHYVHNLIKDCKSRVEKMEYTKDLENFMLKDVVIRIRIAGHFHEDNLNLISESTLRREKLSEDQHVWDVSPLICFQNDLSLKSVLEIVFRISARHRIIVKSDTICDETDETNNSIIIVSNNKQKIVETITTFLEEPFHKISQKWLEDLTIEGGSTESAHGIIAEIEAIQRHIFFGVRETVAAFSVLKRSGSQSIVPDNVKEYLYGLSDVNAFGIWLNSSLKVFVKKNTDEKKMKQELMKINKTFFEKFQLKIEEKKLVQKRTLLQGDQIMTNQTNGRSATLGGFVREINNKRKIYALTCHHMFPRKRQLAYTDSSEEMGACVFTTTDNACDFAAVEINDSFSDKCDLAIRRDDGKRVNAKVYTESLENHGLVFKIGATTDMTKGYIISSEYYDKVIMDLHQNEGSNFLVKGSPGSFSEDGDSGSLVFSRPNCAQQIYVDVLGMVYATHLTVYDDVDFDDDHDISDVSKPHCKNTTDAFLNTFSVCFRIDKALELFKESQGEGFDVQFKDDLSVISTSSLQSYSSVDSLDVK